MKITHCLIGCNDNPLYLDFWPLVKRAWRQIAGIIPVQCYIADEPDARCQSDPDVIFVKAVEGIPTVFQAQMIRMLMASTIETEGAVITSDMDMIPTNKSYWHDAVRSAGEDKFVVYRNVLEAGRQFPICYLGAAPSVWKEIFPAGDAEGARRLIGEWYSRIAGGCDGKHGGRGWFSDQQIIYALTSRVSALADRIVRLDDFHTGFARLDRIDPDIRHLGGNRRFLVNTGAYSDYHMLRPMSEWGEYNNDLLESIIARQRRFAEAAFVTHMRSEQDGAAVQKTIDSFARYEIPLSVVVYGAGPNTPELPPGAYAIAIEDQQPRVPKTIMYSHTRRGVFIPPGVEVMNERAVSILNTAYSLGALPTGNACRLDISDETLVKMHSKRRRNTLGQSIVFTERTNRFMYQWLKALGSFENGCDEWEVFNALRWRFVDDPGLGPYIESGDSPAYWKYLRLA